MRNKTSAIPISIANQLDDLTKRLQSVGVSYVGHGVVSTRGNHTGYFSDKEWQNVYINSTFFHDEPILDRFIQNPSEAVHWKYVENNNVAQMRKEHTGVVNGLTICNVYETFFCFLNLGFASECNTEDFLQANQGFVQDTHQNYDRSHLAWRVTDTQTFPTEKPLADDVKAILAR